MLDSSKQQPIRPQMVTPISGQTETAIIVEDPSRPLIEQIEQVHWLPFAEQALNVYQLSKVQLLFAGELEPLDEYDYPRAGYVTDIWSDTNYPQFFGQRQFWDEQSSSLLLRIGNLSWPCGVDIAEGYGILGRASVGLTLRRVRRDKFNQLTDLRDTEQFAQMLLQDYQAAYAEDDVHYIYPQSREDIAVYELSGRYWLQANLGVESTARKYGFYTAISPEHYLGIYYEPIHFWPQGTDPSPEVLHKVMQPFWDFMNNLRIVENAADELAPGYHGELDAIEADDDSGW